MAKGLTAEEIQSKLSDAIEVGEGEEKGLIVHEVHNGHIVKTYFESRKYPKGDTKPPKPLKS